MRSDGLLLTVILSTGEPMPVHYQDQMGATFVDYLLGTIHILRQHIFGPFMTHPLCQHKHSTLRQQKMSFFKPPTQSFC